MRRLPCVPASALLLALLALAPPAGANPVMRYTWGPATAVVVNQDFTGPATYSQTLSAIGLSGDVRSIEVLLSYGPTAGEGSAWHALFSAPFLPVPPTRTDCEGAPGFSVSADVAGAVTIPGAVPEVNLSSGPGITDPTIRSYLSLRVAIDPPLLADPATRYAIATLRFHHENSVAGTSPDACDGAELPFCFVVFTATAFVATPNPFPSQPLVIESPLLSWQNATGTTNCYEAVTPARPSSWGAIKTLYR